jgi:hypothetical protein
VSRLPFCIALVAMSVLLIYSQYLYVPAYSPLFCSRGFVVVVCSCSSWLCAHERKQKENNVRSIKANYSHKK